MIPRRYELFVDPYRRDESIVDMVERKPLSTKEICKLLNEQEDSIKDYKNKRDSWKRTAGEELSKACKAETKLEILKNKVERLLAESTRFYEMSYEDGLKGEIDAYKRVLHLLKKSEK